MLAAVEHDLHRAPRRDVLVDIVRADCFCDRLVQGSLEPLELELRHVAVPGIAVDCPHIHEASLLHRALIARRRRHAEAQSLGFQIDLHRLGRFSVM